MPDPTPPATTRPMKLRHQIAGVNQIVQIAAIVLAGLWAFYHFRVTEAPTHAQNFATEPAIEWQDATDTSHCYAVFTARFDNLSRSRVRIEKVRRRFWIVPQPRTAQNAAFVNMAEPSSEPVDSLTYTHGPFVQEFPPDAKVSYDLTWLVKRQAGVAVFRVDLFARQADTLPVEWTYAWDDVCEGELMRPAEVQRGTTR